VTAGRLTDDNEQMKLPQRLARFNRHVTNPVQRLWAGWAPGMGVLEHVGRRSGRVYRTPLMVFSTGEGVAILLTYGADRDWLKNLSAAGGGRLRRHGRSRTVRNPQVTTREQAATRVTGIGHRVFAKLPFEEALLLTWGQ
jgi:deazaflavin-dependent oxidoreductase (nitroreductase family)